MANNAKKYNNYNSVNTGDEDTADYPKDSYVKPGTSSNVGKLDEYNKEKIYNKQKSRVILNESKIAPQNYEKKLDDLVPSELGDAIDNVFSTVDNLLSATGKLFFGGRKAPKTPPVSKPQAARPAAPPPAKVQPQPQQAVKPAQQPAPAVKAPAPQRQVAAPQPAAKNIAPPPSAQPQAKPLVKKPQEPQEDIDNTPPVTRSTSISELDLPLELLSDPDIVRYFDQMKLYDKKVTGGLLSLSQRKAGNILKKGRWGKLFMISYDRLKINTMMASAEAGEQRYQGMMPVYKALGRNFTNTDALKKAIEDDINMYLKNGEGSGEFHKFTYKVQRKK